MSERRWSRRTFKHTLRAAYEESSDHDYDSAYPDCPAVEYTPTAGDGPLPWPALLSRSQTGPARSHNCEHYTDCLDLAVAERWPSFVCSSPCAMESLVALVPGSVCLFGQPGAALRAAADSPGEAIRIGRSDPTPVAHADEDGIARVRRTKGRVRHLGGLAPMGLRKAG